MVVREASPPPKPSARDLPPRSRTPIFSQPHGSTTTTQISDLGQDDPSDYAGPGGFSGVDPYRSRRVQCRSVSFGVPRAEYEASAGGEQAEGILWPQYHEMQP